VRRLNPLSGRVVVALLVVVNALLIAGAVHYRHGKPTPVAAATFSPRPHATATTRPPAPAVKAASKSPAPLLSQADTNYVLQATAGCHTTAQLGVTTNNGLTTIPLTAPAAHVLEISTQTTKHAWLVGADARCHPTYYSTTDGGLTWSAASSLGHIWVPLGNGVRSPSGSVTKPCGSKSAEPIAFASANARKAIVICRVGVFRTTTAGRHWLPVTSLPAGRPVNLELSSDGHGTMLLNGLGDCPGLRVAQTSDLGGRWASGDCLNNVQAPAAVSVDSHGDGLVAGAGQQYRSSDSGRNWT
jgi:hypothetical protein